MRLVFVYIVVIKRHCIISWHVSIVQSKMDIEMVMTLKDCHISNALQERRKKIGRFGKKQKHVHLLLVS